MTRNNNKYLAASALLGSLLIATAAPAQTVGVCDWDVADIPARVSMVTASGDRMGCDWTNYKHFMETDYGVKDEDWDDGWGLGMSSPAFGDSPFCLLAESLSMIDRAAEAASSSRWVIKEAPEYIQKNSSTIRPTCDDDALANSKTLGNGWDALTSGLTGLPIGKFVPNRILVMKSHFEVSAPWRASTLYHESRHLGWNKGHTAGPDQDKRYVSLYNDGKNSVYSAQVDWLLDYIDLYPQPAYGDGTEVINRTYRDQAVVAANDRLSSRFETDPLFRVNIIDVAALAAASGTMSVVDQTVELGAFDDKDSSGYTRAYFNAFPTDACALTQIEGNLEEKDHYVWIEPHDYTDPDSGLTATVQTLHVNNDDVKEKNRLAGAARCFPNQTLTTYEFSRGGGDDDLREPFTSAEGTTCFLMGVQGKFEGDYERIGLSVKEGEWWIRLDSNNGISDNRKLKAKVGCIQQPLLETVRQDHDGSSYSAPFDALQASPGDRALSTDLMWPVSCAISDVNGRFRHDSNSVRVQITSCTQQQIDDTGFANCARWRLSVDENWTIDRKISASMTCFEY